jgi:hypothetical protein
VRVRDVELLRRHRDYKRPLRFVPRLGVLTSVHVLADHDSPRMCPREAVLSDYVQYSSSVARVVNVTV